METAEMETMESMQERIPMETTGAGRLSDAWRALWKSLLRRAARKRKTLAVRETAALGDRRFVSVIQFERRRFLIGSSPASITLLAQLPDELVSGAGGSEIAEEKN